MEEITHEGSCRCGQLSYKVAGSPLLSAYCHCTSCQSMNAAAFIHTLHFPYAALSWTHPPEITSDVYCVDASKPGKRRHRCKSCGATIATENLDEGKWGLWGGQFARDKKSGKILGWETIKPTAHMYYDTRMLDIQDELGKWDGYEGTSNRIG